MNFVNGETAQIGVLSKALDGLWMRNQVISDNVANVDTPGFKASKVAFEDVLKGALDDNALKGKVTNIKHIPIGALSAKDVQPQVLQSQNTSMRMDGNNVDIDLEMADLAKTTIAYNAVIQKMTKEFQMLRSAINGGK
ncbi:flagellar basal body rod protein FlgB [Mahella australiensis]|uniref:Flagellar basal body rod protein FlgB n=1 Tax=Mahella australiensis (strain DSM 15567 / CIP 107919 / 50-1 BON) TaxID=697281 RepID=F4A1L3_MAHA5|nr:flagellar basal body rod protein FlgB [Mahella australiensis]AEE96047.1 flagellar basal-body rod protein FlgB [Mahella australiensis 50-1 BON]